MFLISFGSGIRRTLAFQVGLICACFCQDVDIESLGFAHKYDITGEEPRSGSVLGKSFGSVRACNLHSLTQV